MSEANSSCKLAMFVIGLGCPFRVVHRTIQNENGR